MSCACGKASEKFCSACGVVRYCSPECQRRDWPEHKKACSPQTPTPHAELAELARLFRLKVGLSPSHRKWPLCLAQWERAALERLIYEEAHSAKIAKARSHVASQWKRRLDSLTEQAFAVTGDSGFFAWRGVAIKPANVPAAQIEWAEVIVFRSAALFPEAVFWKVSCTMDLAEERSEQIIRPVTERDVLDSRGRSLSVGVAVLAPEGSPGIVEAGTKSRPDGGRSKGSPFVEVLDWDTGYPVAGGVDFKPRAEWHFASLGRSFADFVASAAFRGGA